ncbi:hypothetical protein FHS16_003095 [Paenibacillus endophyticus]|uniref:Uncharacterized protein n=1 Tax=Paenibacillus endophyticus TaxID=1294268 RepID=A0A7W5C8F1_9BACL|nr:hypothetical protein [Paenibacillus endophyticus]MBB3153036.1 hypothetical protein [Paenibacillus endophyticus]
MRKYQLLEESTNPIKKVMLYETHEGAYVFLYHTYEDKPCFADYWFELVEDADDYCKENLNIVDNNWRMLDDPKIGCQHDLIECT